MSSLTIEGLRAAVNGKEILKGVDLEIKPGEVHAVMGPNGSGKSTLSHVLMGRPGYEVLGGSVKLDGVELLDQPTWKRAELGLFLAMQYPIEVPGVFLDDVFAASVAVGQGTALEDRVKAEADRIGFDHAFLDRALNVDLSGGEKKRNETLQLSVLAPRYAVLDELDSGLDVDALRMVSQRVEAATEESGLGVLVITHYSRLLTELRPDHVHVLAQGRFVTSGGPELAEQLEASGYAGYVDADEDETASAGSGSEGNGTAGSDPFADPFADPLA
jgi:Fe-S cluster assembly ATP-binding protein